MTCDMSSLTRRVTCAGLMIKAVALRHLSRAADFVASGERQTSFVRAIQLTPPTPICCGWQFIAPNGAALNQPRVERRER